jgi:hypothetical protein
MRTHHSHGVNVKKLRLGFSNTTRNPEGILSQNNRKSVLLGVQGLYCFLASLHTHGAPCVCSPLEGLRGLACRWFLGQRLGVPAVPILQRDLQPAAAHDTTRWVSFSVVCAAVSCGFVSSQLRRGLLVASLLDHPAHHPACLCGSTILHGCVAASGASGHPVSGSVKAVGWAALGAFLGAGAVATLVLVRDRRRHRRMWTGQLGDFYSASIN